MQLQILARLLTGVGGVRVLAERTQMQAWKLVTRKAAAARCQGQQGLQILGLASVRIRLFFDRSDFKFAMLDVFFDTLEPSSWPTCQHFP